MKLQGYNDITKEYIIYSEYTGEEVFSGKVKDFEEAVNISNAVRKTEYITYEYTIRAAIQKLEIMY